MDIYKFEGQMPELEWYLGPNEPEAGSVLVANVLTSSETELESKEVQVEKVGFDDNVQKEVKKQLLEPEMLGGS